MKRRETHSEPEEKILDVDASIEGKMIFKDPVNLRINGKFQGDLDTRGSLTVGERADVRADIVGEDITIAGRVVGDVTARRHLQLIPPAVVVGIIKSPNLTVQKGAIFQGECHMLTEAGQRWAPDPTMSIEEVAEYLEVDVSTVAKWAEEKRVPGKQENGIWLFDKTKVDAWVSSEKVKS
ncbi:MAG: polymer-forming cytoskeletal protein [Candidatus Omnitrophica bacterium]|nr:polymer-forming cytoskeletal protein [Candidatus Omnitrophota bacterium]